MPVGLVIVSHSAKIAEGIVELAAQMAPGVTIVAAGGTDDAGIGTSFDKVSAAVVTADDSGGAKHSGVVVLCDLGSAILTTETALDFLDDELKARVRVADAPIVEGAVAAAVAAAVGEDLDAVVSAAESAKSVAPAAADDAPAPHGPDEPVAAAANERVTGSATLINETGLHARPASEFVRMASGFDAHVTINGVDAKSLLSIMGLGLGKGSVVQLEATGSAAGEAIAALTKLLESGFGE